MHLLMRTLHVDAMLFVFIGVLLLLMQFRQVGFDDVNAVVSNEYSDFDRVVTNFDMEFVDVLSCRAGG